MKLILFDDKKWNSFLPLAFTKPVCDLLGGATSNRLRWEMKLGMESHSLTREYLQVLFPISVSNDNLLVNGRMLPTKDILTEVKKLKVGEKLVSEDVILAARMNGDDLRDLLNTTKYDRLELLHKADIKQITSNYTPSLLNEVWDFFLKADELLRLDAPDLVDKDFSRKSGEGNTYLGESIHIHESAKVNASVLNSSSGPIIIDEGAEIMEGCLIRGPFYLGKHSVLKMGAKIYGPTSIGKHCKVGGEVNNSVINSFSNKAHDGFLGNAVLGQWCNLGADSNNSNLKNDYSIVKLWNYTSQSFARSSLQFLGLIMGDHSKCGINTMFNTGTVAGVFCNIYGSGFQPNFIPSFSWGKPGTYQTYQFEKALQVAGKVMERRGMKLSREDEKVLKHVFDTEQELREKFNKAP